jgi:hypothetical protein
MMGGDVAGAPAATRRPSTVVIRIAGALFVVAGGFRVGALLLLQLAERLSHTGTFLSNDGFGQVIFASILVAFSYAVLGLGFALLWLAQLRSLWQLVFLAIALGDAALLVAEVQHQVVPDFVRVASLLVILVASLAAAAVVVWKRQFGPVTGILFVLFLVAEAYSAFAALANLDPADFTIASYVLQFSNAGTAIVAGVALVVRPRTRSTATGLSET